MKKILFLFPLALFISGCSFNATNQKINSAETPKQIEISDTMPTKTTEAHEDFYIKNDYLWHKDKRMTDQSLTALKVNPNYANLDYDLGVDIWHKTTEPYGKIMLYLEYSGGCEGCNYISPYYFVIDPQTDTAELKKFKNDFSPFFHDRNPLFVISPSGKQIAHVEYASTDYEGNGAKIGRTVRSEKVYLVDFISETETKIADVKANKTVLHPLEGDSMFSGFPVITENAIYFKADNNGKEQLIVNPQPYNPAKLLQKDKENFKDICEKEKNCEGLVAFQPTQNSGYYTNNGYLIMDSKRNIVVDDQISSSRYTYNLTLYPIDFNNDGQNEYILYYNDQNNAHPGLTGDNIKIYRFDGSRWITEYEKKEGLIDGASDTHTLIKKESFLEIKKDPDGNGLLEAVVKLGIQTLFNDPVYKYTMLKWDGTKIVEQSSIPIPIPTPTPKPAPAPTSFHDIQYFYDTPQFPKGVKPFQGYKKVVLLRGKLRADPIYIECTTTPCLQPDPPTGFYFKMVDVNDENYTIDIRGIPTAKDFRVYKNPIVSNLKVGEVYIISGTLELQPYAYGTQANLIFYPEKVID